MRLAAPAENVTALLLGRVTFEGFADAWPSTEGTEGEFAVPMNALPKVVACHKRDWELSDTKVTSTGVPCAPTKPQAGRLKECDDSGD